jgi:D-alanine-D-alanine ligase
MKKINVVILFGGRSAEHEVSLQSAKNVFNAIDKKKYNPILIKIEKDGKWALVRRNVFSSDYCDSESSQVVLIPQNGGRVIGILKKEKTIKVDVVFPVLHGPFGEDGTVQGLLKLLNVPFVGPGVLGCAVGMDKDVMKRLFKNANLPIGKFITIDKIGETPKFEEVKKSMGAPLFIKPANLGSSVGISKVFTEKEYRKGIKSAFRYDRKVLVEEYIKGREIECSVLGNEGPQASVLGEIKPKKDFYSYEAKYTDDSGAELEAPAKIAKKKVEEIQKLAVKVFKVLCCEGMGRVDFFLKDNGEVIVNEINAIPGFTKISMYPKLWELSGISYTKLIDKLIILAIERFKKEEKLETSYDKK